MFEVIIFVLVLVLLLYFAHSLTKNIDAYNQYLKSLADDASTRINDLHEFSYNIYFEPFPSTIVIDNPYPCTEEALRKCSTLDVFSCEGCQNLTATCKHFSESIEYIKQDGTTLTIPANDSPTEGYCLSIKTLFERCNPYHGSLVLVQRTANSTESLLICDCTRPGYIGNLTLSGNCETPFICGGKIQDINVPYEQIECECSTNTVSDFINNTPYCRPKRVIDELAKFNLPDSSDTFAVQNMSQTYRDNLPGVLRVRSIPVGGLDGLLVPAQDEDGHYTHPWSARSEFMQIPITYDVNSNYFRTPGVAPQAYLKLNSLEIYSLNHYESADYITFFYRLNYNKSYNNYLFATKVLKLDEATLKIFPNIYVKAQPGMNMLQYGIPNYGYHMKGNDIWKNSKLHHYTENVLWVRRDFLVCTHEDRWNRGQESSDGGVETKEVPFRPGMRILFQTPTSEIAEARAVTPLFTLYDFGNGLKELEVNRHLFNTGLRTSDLCQGTFEFNVFSNRITVLGLEIWEPGVPAAWNAWAMNQKISIADEEEEFSIGTKRKLLAIEDGDTNSTTINNKKRGRIIELGR